MSDPKLRGIQAFYSALLAYRDRVRATYVPSESELRTALGVDPDDDSWESVWDLDADCVDVMWERLGPADAIPYLRAVWERPDDFYGDARGRAMHYLMSPTFVDLNPLVPFLVSLSGYDVSPAAVVPVDWVMRNRDALREVWIYKRIRFSDPTRGRGIYGVRAEMLRVMIVVDYVDVDAELDTDDLDLRCSLIREYGLDNADHINLSDGLDLSHTLNRDYKTLTALGVGGDDARDAMRHGYPRDVIGLPVVDDFDAARVAGAWTACVDAGVPRPLIPALATSDEPLPDVLDAVDTFRGLNADGGFPFPLAAAGLGVPDTLMSDEAWNAWCGTRTDPETDT